MMNRILLTYIRIITLVLICGCTTFQRKEMANGERLFRANCRACHTLPDANKFTDSEWVDLVRRYADPLEIPVEDQKLILEYIQDNN